MVDADGKAVTVTAKDGGYTFTMPGSNVTVTATFKDTPVTPELGDTFPIGLIVVLMVACVAGVVVILVAMNRKKKEQ